jgi:protein involved in polysaccharide export with SLBB domain
LKTTIRRSHEAEVETPDATYYLRRDGSEITLGVGDLLAVTVPEDVMVQLLSAFIALERGTGGRVPGLDNRSL